MDKTIGKFHLGMGNIIGNVALEAAYQHGKDWLLQLISYLQKNIAFTKDFINNYIPVLELIEPEATFLLWIDFRKIPFKDAEIADLLVKQAQVGLSNGILFGKDGEGFQRINIGCPHLKLEKGLKQIASSLKKITQ
jgi:cystathionine beta-lyase